MVLDGFAIQQGPVVIGPCVPQGRRRSVIQLSNSPARVGQKIVITGLDPVIHLLRIAFLKIDGCPDQVRA
jgi:hypothetical protein